MLPVARFNIQQVWDFSYDAFNSSGLFQSDAQKKAALAIRDCKSGSLGVNISQCPDCGYIRNSITIPAATAAVPTVRL